MLDKFSWRFVGTLMFLDIIHHAPTMLADSAFLGLDETLKVKLDVIDEAHDIF